MKIRLNLAYFALIAALITGAFSFTAQNAWGITDNDSILKERLQDSVVIYPRSMYALVDNEIEVLDPENDLITPFIQNGRILVPVRFISEAFGAKVSWNQITKTATIIHGNTTVKITSYSERMDVNGEQVGLDVPAMITGGRTFIPARALAEALGKKVFYDRGLVVFSKSTDIFDIANERNLIDLIIAKINILPTVGSRENLVKLLSAAEPYSGGYTILPEKTIENAPSNEISDSATDSNGTDYSRTNIQVEGVDEADIVKTDGNYIYQVSNNEILIYKAFPATALELVSEIAFNGSSFTPAELYIKGDDLLVIGSEYAYLPMPIERTAPLVDRIYPMYNYNTTKVLVYDVSVKAKPVQTRELSMQGDYLSSRLIGDDLYFISNQYIYGWTDPMKPLNPEYRDTAVKDETMTVPFGNIRYIPPVQYNSYLMIAGVALDDPDKAMNVSAYLGAGEEIYVSQDNLYVTVYEGFAGIRPMVWTVEGFAPAPQQEATLIYKFALKEARAVYLAKGQVPGRVLNQFSMDENKGSFRIATTLGQSWMSSIDESSNNVYILNNDLYIAGKLENLAPGERIYSVRFLNDRGYMVTFRTIDPLFVIDLADPKAPTVLGTLKIPGYSDYLHPYDENHIIGFGKDTITVPYKDSSGNVISSNTYDMGMKIALFDVSDVKNPVQKYSVKIGDRGTDSELLYDHKALLFDKTKNLLAFPVNETKVEGPVIDPVYGYPNYGNLVFNGAYVYQLDLQQGFALKGRVSHLKDQDYMESGYYDVDYNKKIRRILYIDNTLYGISNNEVSAYDLNTLKELASVKK